MFNEGYDICTGGQFACDIRTMLNSHYYDPLGECLIVMIDILKMTVKFLVCTPISQLLSR